MVAVLVAFEDRSSPEGGGELVDEFDAPFGGGDIADDAAFDGIKRLIFGDELVLEAEVGVPTLAVKDNRMGRQELFEEVGAAAMPYGIGDAMLFAGVGFGSRASWLNLSIFLFSVFWG